MQSIPKIWIGIAISMISTMAMASIFDGKIRYFEPAEENSAQGEKSKEVRKEKDDAKKKFDWNSYLDIERDEFFREGDYIPPAPFMEAMRRPTPENILLFEKWQQTKNLLLERYEAARARYLGEKNHAPVTPKINALDSKSDLQKYRFVFYFDATCSSCKAMFTTVNQMIERGIYVEAVRVDNGKQEIRGLTIPWNYATPKEIKANGLSAVPFLMAFDDKAKKVFRLTGRKTMQEISQLIGHAGG
jgi:hypothetical protein